MTILTPEEGLAKLEAKGSAITPHLKNEQLPDHDKFLLMPNDVRSRAQTIDFILDRPEWAQGGCFWVYDIVWEVKIDEIFTKMRSLLNETRTIWEAPAHFFTQEEIPQLEPLLTVAAYFEWDFWLITSDESLRLFHSHDEFLGVSSPSKQTLSDFETFFASDKTA